MNNYFSSLHIPSLLLDFNQEEFSKMHPNESGAVKVVVDSLPHYLKEGKSIVFQFKSIILNSQLAVHVLREVIERDFLDADYLSAEQVVLSFKNTWSSNTVDFDRDYYRLLDRDFLVVDSIIAEYLDSFGSRVFCQFLEKRLLNQKSTIITRGNMKYNDRLTEIIAYKVAGIPDVPE